MTLSGRPVLSAVDLSFRAGERVAVLGPSGAGKTTLLRVIVGAVRPHRGDVRVDGADPFESRAALMRLRRSIGCIRQRDDLIHGLSARTNILVSVSYEWRPRDWAAVLFGNVPRRFGGRLAEIARRHEIEDVLGTPVERLSGGQRQRVAVARALFGGPRLVLADEATTGLDPVRAVRVLDDLRRPGTTLIATTHDLTIAQRFPRVIALREGAVVFDGDLTDATDLRQIYGGDTTSETVS
ncbi:MAG TPA: ATP-binding cassette domain-containing protein [Streptosporangiaceae bacterium]|nr:ATP-binding cassette domain-containing protein [Streptosporangiaceae bacterium]